MQRHNVEQITTIPYAYAWFQDFHGVLRRPETKTCLYWGTSSNDVGRDVTTDADGGVVRLETKDAGRCTYEPLLMNVDGISGSTLEDVWAEVTRMT